MTIFNKDNNDWETGGSKVLILGQQRSLYDSVNTPHPHLFQNYKLQKSIDWQETEISLEQSRLDLLYCPPAIRDLMLITLAYQWEVDSIACHSFAVLLAPFISNSEFWASTLKNSEIEVLHALTYSEIGRICLPNQKELFELVMKNDQILGRSSHLISVLEDLQRAGAEYTLGLVENDQALFNRVFKGLFAMFLIERVQFMASFAVTFAIGEQNLMVGICKLVQKIAIDELTVHANTLEYVLKELIANDPRGKIAFEQCHEELELLSNELRKREHSWNKYIFSKGRKMVGMNAPMLDEWVDFNLGAARAVIGLDISEYPTTNPLRYMENWFDIDKTQTAQQESGGAGGSMGNNYILNATVNDLDEDEVLDF